MVNLKLLFLNSSQIKVRRIFFLESAIEGRIYGGLKGCMPYALISGQCKCLCLMLETYTPHRRLQTKEDKNKTPLATSKIKVLSISLKGRLCSRDKHQNREAEAVFWVVGQSLTYPHLSNDLLRLKMPPNLFDQGTPSYRRGNKPRGRAA